MDNTVLTPYNPTIYTGRAEPFEPMAKYWYQHILAYDNQPIALIGFACDQGVNRNLGRIGAKSAPNNIKTAFGKLPISHRLTSLGANLDNWVGDMGNVACLDNDVIIPNTLENAQNAYAQQIANALKKGSTPIGLGGGHEIAWGSFLGLYQGLQGLQDLQGLQELTQNTDTDNPNADNNKQPSKKTTPKIGIINLDAHFDLRCDKYATSGTPFYQIAQFLAKNEEPFYYLCIGISEFANSASLFHRANTLGVVVIDEQDCLRLPFDKIARRINDFIANVDVLYLTVDMDCLMGSVMPSVSAVNAGGLSVYFVERCMAYIIGSGKVRLIDMAEINPKYDIDGLGLKVAGRVLASAIGAVIVNQ